MPVQLLGDLAIEMGKVFTGFFAERMFKSRTLPRRGLITGGFNANDKSRNNIYDSVTSR